MSRSLHGKIPTKGAPGPAPLPAAGGWIWTCREGFEADLLEDLHHAGPRVGSRVLAPALVLSDTALPVREGGLDLTFARQGFPLAQVLRGDGRPALATEAAEALVAALDAARPWALHTWVPDSTAGNLLSSVASALHGDIEHRVATRAPALAARRTSAEQAARLGGVLAQVCLAAEGQAYVGVLDAVEAITLAPGGRARMRVAEEAPSRAAMKLEEALDWLGFGPEAGDRCVDLGAAPGGWTWVLLERRAQVVAVDPARLRPDLARRRGVTYVPASAFDYEPRAPVDWLFCDMAWRPLEVAALLAKWGRRRWARTLVANLKLPMKDKVAFVQRLRGIVASGGWRDVQTRQLYHDREEFTLKAWRG